ncbi:hypothetical protein A2303_01735 [Candidatus Falkowbacteria bacterium RIFOXYB2_FULL_47_14]|uniref:Type II secretion system protein GspG C-terminal domain-containing protein n=1 Tax=Candidatus Falkowbacteria bacterium RIFOXYA2_FULL_47_19 TaxID=1797994 RepID=A0A1F5SJK8_9BACT|nr:MAG: hypothetical protein A2227_06200 [Candidatus Falkowbacteria bacterium RIFOXYA2_FULL_47_19]OGF37104.1 MAG: hypothetical protein A2468_05390 [Candidatus Falkowbacteria bacterium RIFOXYC2_FULL_46_15]OGF43236.1 MAG: hypothetical protein A2303_01735 [Candidatus Falkowbacteria bacterium RIFOXYB2_FULL_47_14]
MKNNKGFTLIELLIVIAIIAALSALAFVALNPLARFQDSRNTKRWTDVNMLVSALKLDQVDNGGLYLGDIEDLTVGNYHMIGKGNDCSVITCFNPTVELQTVCIDLSELVDEGYLPDVPIDPNADGADEEYTYYYLSKTSSSTITVGACSEESGSNEAVPEIMVTR